MDKAAITELLKKDFSLDTQSDKVLVVGLGRTVFQRRATCQI
jgi:hypothetical protein